MDENQSAFAVYRNLNRSKKKNKHSRHDERNHKKRRKDRVVNNVHFKAKKEPTIAKNAFVMNAIESLAKKKRHSSNFKQKKANNYVNDVKQDKPEKKVVESKEPEPEDFFPLLEHIDPKKTRNRKKKMQQKPEEQQQPKEAPVKQQNAVANHKPKKKQTNLAPDEEESLSSLSEPESNDQDDEEMPTTTEVAEKVSEEDSSEIGLACLNWMLNPKDASGFLINTWEKRPLHISRDVPDYYSSLISCEAIDEALRTRNIFYDRNIDITSYSDGVRETHNIPGRARAPVVWDYYKNGCSVRILNPQSYFNAIYCLNAALQEYFGCMVGANVYLTPAGTQGFAPHYDDIEAFILQVEGKKHWKLYAPKTPNDQLPRESSKNFTEAELGKKILDVVLKPGDLLYFPRGTVHQGCALKGNHSLHVTVSVYQKQSWADFFEKLLPAALKAAQENDVAFRRGLPVGFLRYTGMVHSDLNTPDRFSFVNTIDSLIKKLTEYLPIDATCDQMSKQFLHDSLPPALDQDEWARTSAAGGGTIRKGKVASVEDVQITTRVRLLRRHCVRLVGEEDELRLYYSVDNGRTYHEEELQFLVVDEAMAPAIELLIHTYPKYMGVRDLPLDDDDSKLQLAGDLWERGLLIVE